MATFNRKNKKSEEEREAELEAKAKAFYEDAETQKHLSEASDNAKKFRENIDQILQQRPSEDHRASCQAFALAEEDRRNKWVELTILLVAGRADGEVEVQLSTESGYEVKSKDASPLYNKEGKIIKEIKALIRKL